MPQEYELNIADYLRIFHKRKLIITAIFVISILVSLFHISLQPPIYQAFSTVKVLERQSVAGILTEWIVYTPANVMKSEAEIIKGFPVMKRVALRLGLIDDAISQSEARSVVKGLQGKISAETIKSTNVIRITATSGDAIEAMELANIVAEVYVEENLLEKKRQASNTRQFIEEQLAELQERLSETENRQKELNEEIGDIRLAEPIQKRLMELEFQLATLLQRYTDKHPTVMRLKEQIGDLEKQLTGFSGADLEYARLTREIEVSKKLYVMLKEKLEEARISEAQKVGDVSLVDPASLPRSPIGPRKKTGIMLGAFFGLLLGAIFAFIIESMDTTIRSIDEMENLTKLPVLGIVPSVTASYMEEAEDFFRKIYTRFFPSKRKYTKKEDSYICLAVYHEPKSSIAEAYRNIRTNLKLSPSLRTILVTSAGPREGKTTIVTNLGLIIALSGERTLLVSSDLRRPAIAKAFGVKKEPGLSEILTRVKDLDEGLRNVEDLMLGGIELNKVMQSPGIENMSILPAGHTPDNPAELLESKEIENLVGELKNRFDVIIFDSPPVLPITDASLLAPKVDGVVLVYEAGTTKNAFLRAKMQLESAGAKILGVILNHIKPESEMGAGYPYYSYKYKYYYGEGEKLKKKREKIVKKDSSEPKKEV